jgi:hypothetical protein
LVRFLDGRGEFDQLVLGQRGLEEGEENAFLAADVGVQAAAELVQLFGCRSKVADEVGCAAAEIDVIGQHADDGVVRGRMMTGEGWEQDVLLDAEVVVSVAVPVGEKGVACDDGGRLGGAVEPLGDDEAVVVV